MDTAVSLNDRLIQAGFQPHKPGEPGGDYILDERARFIRQWLSAAPCPFPGLLLVGAVTTSPAGGSETLLRSLRADIAEKLKAAEARLAQAIEARAAAAIEEIEAKAQVTALRDQRFSYDVAIERLNVGGQPSR